MSPSNPWHPYTKQSHMSTRCLSLSLPYNTYRSLISDAPTAADLRPAG